MIHDSWAQIIIEVYCSRLHYFMASPSVEHSRKNMSQAKGEASVWSYGVPWLDTFSLLIIGYQALVLTDCKQNSTNTSEQPLTNGRRGETSCILHIVIVIAHIPLFQHYVSMWLRMSPSYVGPDLPGASPQRLFVSYFEGSTEGDSMSEQSLTLKDFSRQCKARVRIG